MSLKYEPSPESLHSSVLSFAAIRYYYTKNFRLVMLKHFCSAICYQQMKEKQFVPDEAKGMTDDRPQASAFSVQGLGFEFDASRV